MIKKSTKGKTTTYVHDQEIIAVGNTLIEKLKREAGKDPFGRARFCLHRDEHDPIQDMVIAFRRSTFVQPHTHPRGVESYHVIEGSILLVFFTPSGRILRTILLAANKQGVPFLFRVGPGNWHMAIILSDYAVIHEVTQGPFTKNASVYASWSPDEGDSDGVKTFMGKIKKNSKVKKYV